jgi:hypothetical protein
MPQVQYEDFSPGFVILAMLSHLLISKQLQMMAGRSCLFGHGFTPGMIEIVAIISLKQGTIGHGD